MTYKNINSILTSADPPPEKDSRAMRGMLSDLVRYYEDSTTSIFVQKDGKWIYLNASALKLLGYENLADIKGTSIWEVIDPADHDTVKKRIQSSINGVNPGVLEQKWLRQDGEIITVEVTAIPVANQMGQTTGIVKKVEDSSRQIKETIEHYKLITDNMNEIVSLLDHRGNLIYISPSYRDFSKDGIHNEIGKSSIKYVHKDDKAFVKREFLKLLKYKKPITIQYRLRKIDGTYRFFESQGTCIPNGEDCQFVVVSRDVTERNIAETRLRVSEQKHRAILEHSSDLICMMNQDGIVVYASSSYKSLLGYEQEEVVGKDILTFIHPEDNEKCQKTIMKLTETKQPVTTVYRKIHHSGQVNQFVFISRDITEKIKLEQYRENIEKLSLIGDVAAGFAHEIRNPLTSIKGFINLLAKESSCNEEHYHRIIDQELEKIEEVINGFISLAKPEAVEIADVSLLKLIKNAISVLTPQASSKNIRININSQLKTIVIQCKKNQMKQVFINILKNAVEAIEKDGQINITLEEIDDEICVIIHDNGVGIEEERLERIGVPFYTNKEKGIGLGMTVSNKIITEHKGRLELNSKPGKGTRVVIHLPKAPFLI
ncbi:PAS domain S-box protein [Pseudalkalibacillus hwajinpoensis]|uniref:PAS domain S-box protein n=1 Tax=Guptibacillus hwajinpoensis TaxID=208199 RepID=UPI00325A782A